MNPFLYLLTALFPNREFADISGYVTKREDVEEDSTITDYPIETGSEASDHIILHPTQITLECIFNGNKERLKQLYSKIRALRLNREVFPIVTGKLYLPQVVLKSIHENNSRATENCLALELTFREIQYTSVQIEKISKPSKQEYASTTQSPTTVGEKAPAPVAQPGIVYDAIQTATGKG